MNPTIAAGVAGALISGVAMYTVGARSAHVEAFTPNPALVQTVDGQYVPASYTTALRPVAAPVATTSNTRRAAAPQPQVTRTVTRTAPREVVVEEDAREVVVEEDVRPERSWGKTAMIVGGSTAGGAGVGGIVGGKKGALIGAAIGGGAASIYEATRRR
jgi:hypothetical protein